MFVRFSRSLKRPKIAAGRYRLILATWLFLLAYPLLFVAFFKETERKLNITNTELSVSESAYGKDGSKESHDKLYVMDVLDYYKNNQSTADDRTNLTQAIVNFIKNPPIKSEVQLYERYQKVSQDFRQIRLYRQKLDNLAENQMGRNRSIEEIAAHRDKYLQLEAELFYQLEKIVYFSKQSYLDWQIFQNKDMAQIADLQKHSVRHSEQSAELFENFSNALSQYTNRKLTQH